MTKVAYASDLHLEFTKVSEYCLTEFEKSLATFANPGDVDVLILAGDICLAEDLARHPIDLVEPFDKRDSYRAVLATLYRRFFRYVASQYQTVLYVAGNHESYKGNQDETIKILRDALAPVAPNVRVMDNDSIRINDVLFIGATLWTDANRGDPMTLWHLRQAMNDFNVIRLANKGYRKFSPDDAANEFAKSLDYIKAVLSNPSTEEVESVVLVTHHAVTYESIPERFRHDTYMNGGFASDLSSLIAYSPKIKVCVHGHIHDRTDYQVGDARVLCNPRGYPNEGEDEFTLETFVA